MIRRLAIIGVGLIGGSLARALRAAGAVGEVVGSGRRAEHLQQAVDLGVIDRFSTDPAAAVTGADLIVVAVPLGAMGEVFRAIVPHLAADAVVTDVGSAKAAVVTALREALGEVPDWFVPGHPIAGTERSGVAASFAELFQGRRVILTPLAHTDPQAVARVRAMWQHAGAEVVEMGVELHDEVLAATSHLPHVLAFALVDSLARMHEHNEIFTYAAGGFRDFTRIASSDPVMWRDICLANRAALLDMIERFNRDLGEMTRAIEDGDGDALLEIFSRAKQARDEHVLRGEE
ncbi:prephenate dehydrogenase/arogenate dehydrogenase family protein [Thiohalobacter sp. IOR34]|uniref:prephenate dehydrogenase n=1 Tax=Thiohalobacter sp. IOR34 TaxID=3057176 RepID=UPI0025B0411D|nr:prephenate dehydrogenase/arogenate dehydrogenase family protein [Thiohalobacter sp. IOR34]WJW76689.1 prephenate dehydrogenase/arogenate dehydrogenase family protein [Thiohalobacter sp. IOR34]